MRALAIASALFSVLLFTLNDALARASDPPVATVRPNGQAHAAARGVSIAVTARTAKVQARKFVTVRLPKSAT